MPSINEVYKNRLNHGMRINRKLLDICAKTGLSTNSIVEACLVYFATLDDDARIQFLAQNDPEKVDASNIIEPDEENSIKDRAVVAAKGNIGKTPSRFSEKILITIGLALLAAFFVVVVGKKQEK